MRKILLSMGLNSDPPIGKKMSPKIIASAPGKIILSGEHAVVYGYPALVAAIDKRISVDLSRNNEQTIVEPAGSKGFVKNALDVLHDKFNFPNQDLKIKLNTTIPIGRGMGSSAAFAVALSAALLLFKNKKADLELISDYAYELEKKYHGNPSGVDISISVNGGILWYRKESEEFKTFSKVIISNLPTIYILDTGKPKESTKETVFHVSEMLKEKPQKILKIFNEMEKVTRAFLQYITGEKQLNFVELIKTNERFLEKLGVVSRSTINLIKQIEKIGGAAKISGGGGITAASGIILVYHPDQEKLISFMGKLNLKPEIVKLGGKGVKIE
jgi:mevalonate kinase